MSASSARCPWAPTETPKGALAAAVSKRGFGMRVALEPHRELSTRAGRRFAKPADGDEIVGVARVLEPKDVVCVVTSDARALVCKADELPELANPGRGVTVIKTGEETVVGFGVGRAKDKDVLIAETDDGKELPDRSRAVHRHLARRQGPRAQAQDQDRARDVGRAAGAGRAARAAELRWIMASTSYTSEHITVLEGLEPVRRRPGMYIGGTDSKGYHHLLWEIVDNSVDEVINGYGSRIEVTLHKDGKSVTVNDDGRGIPVDIKKDYKKSALELVLTTLHAGGKFGGSQYEFSGGLHGVGSSVVNALSEEMIAQVKRDATRWEQTYARGKATSKLKKVGPARGTGHDDHLPARPGDLRQAAVLGRDDPLPAGREGVPAQGPDDRLHRRSGRHDRRRSSTRAASPTS